MKTQTRLYLLLAFSAGVLVGALAIYLPSLSVPVPSRSPQVANIQVAPGEAWASAWDVEHGQVVEPSYTESEIICTNLGTRHTYTIQVRSGKELVGLVLADGSAVVIRRDEENRQSTVVLASPKPPPVPPR